MTILLLFCLLISWFYRPQLGERKFAVICALILLAVIVITFWPMIAYYAFYHSTR